MFKNNKSTSMQEVINSLSYWVLLVTAVALPAFAFITNDISTLISKVFFGSFLILLALLFFAIAHMRKQELTAPKSLILATAWSVPLAYVFSMLFAPGGGLFFGERLLMDSTAFIVVLFVALTLSAIVLNTTKRALGLYFAMLVSAVVLTVSELYLFFQRYQAVQEGVAGYNMKTLSLVGSLNDLGIFFGLIIVFLLLSLIMLPVTNVVRSILWVVLAASLYFLAVVNLEVLWWIIGAFALAFLVHSVSDMYFSEKKETLKKGVSIASIVVLLVSATFIFVPPTTQTGATSITGLAAKSLEVGEFDVRPSWKTTVTLGSKAFEEQGSIFGAGPGSFYYVWAQHFPDSINVSAFWLTDFFYGIGFIPTSVISTGLLGALAWLLFFGTFLWRGTRQLVLHGDVRKGDMVGYVRVTSFVAALFLWIAAVIMVPSPVLLIFAALFTGVFISSLTFGAGKEGVIAVSFKAKPQIGFISTLGLTCIVLLSVAGMYGVYTRYDAELTYQAAVRAIANDGDIDEAYTLVTDAIRKNELDVYYRFKSNLDAIKIQNLMAENRPPEEVREEFQSLLQKAINSGLSATKLDKRDYQNWSNLGGIYQSIVALGVDGSIDNALDQYDNALQYRPKSPTIYYAKAVLERYQGDIAAARSNVEKAITMRNQYTDAIFLLAQLQIAQEETQQAINSVEAITLFNPNNAVAHFQLGLLHYSEESYVNAARSFERAVNIDENYANARYFLALSYWRLGDDGKALENLRRVQETNPENQEIARMIENLENGDDPFAHLEGTPNIEDRMGLPISDIGDGSELDVDINELAE